MLSGYLTVMVRHLLRHRFYALLNVLGLSIGVGCMLVAVLFVDYHFQWDAGHEHTDRIYRVIRHVKDADGTHFERTTHHVGTYLQAQLPEVEEAVRVLNRKMWVGREGRGFNEKVAVVDSAFTRVFTVPMVRGDAKTGLQEYGSCFISEGFASRVFGDEDPIGKTVSIAFKWLAGEYRVTGVMKDVSSRSNSFLKYEILTATYQFVEGRDHDRDRWDEWPRDGSPTLFCTYLLMRRSADMAAFKSKLHAFSEAHKRPDARRQVDYLVQPLAKMHLYTLQDYEIAEPFSEDIRRCYAVLGIGCLVLMLSGLNYITVVTAQSSTRAREVGLRKVCGARRGHLIGQFLGESMFVTAIASVIAVGIAYLCLPAVNDILGVELSLTATSAALLVALPLLIVPGIGVLAGFYPAFVLSSHPPVRTVTGSREYGSRRFGLRSALVVIQFSASGVLIVGTLVVHGQVEYMRSKDPGFRRDGIVLLPLFQRAVDKPAALRQAEAIRNEMTSVPGVVNASAIFLPPHRIGETDFRDVTAEGSTNVHRLYYQSVDAAYGDTFDIPFVSGRPPETVRWERLTETERITSVVINERAAEVLGWGEDAVGKRCFQEFRRQDGTATRSWFRITGVVRDYHNRPLRDGIEPVLIHMPGTWSFNFVAVRLASGSMVEPIDQLEAIWGRFLPGQPFEYEFMDAAVEKLYRTELQLRRVFGFFAVLSIVVGCLGILGLVTYAAERRTKEFGVRKVLGASNAGLLYLLSSDFLKLIGASFAIAWPIAYFLVREWLSGFAYHIEVGTAPFLVTGSLTLILVALTVAIQIWRSATADPVHALRYE